MVFRLVHGGLKENLSLTPIINEWHIRGLPRPLKIETSMTEVFKNNPYVDEVGDFFENDTPAIDFDCLENTQSHHLVDLYAAAALGDTKLVFRKLFYSDINLTCKIPSRSIAFGQEFAKQFPNIVSFYKSQEKPVDTYSTILKGSALDRLDDISGARVYIGLDEDDTYLAMATNTPIIFLHGWRPKNTCKAFRNGIPCELLSWECNNAANCVKNLAEHHFGNCLYVKCNQEVYKSCQNKVDENLIKQRLDYYLNL